MSPEPNLSPNTKNRPDDDVTEYPLDAKQSVVFRALLRLAIAASPSDMVLGSVRSQLSDGPSRVTLSNRDFTSLVSLLQKQVDALSDDEHEKVAKGLLNGWRPVRDGGTKIIITQ